MLIAKIPGKLNNKRIVGIIDRLRRIEKAIKRDFSGNDLQNKKAYEHLLTSPDHGAFVLAGMKEHKPLSAPALIERQSELKDMSLGKSTLDYSGCVGWFRPPGHVHVVWKHVFAQKEDDDQNYKDDEISLVEDLLPRYLGRKKSRDARQHPVEPDLKPAEESSLLFLLGILLGLAFISHIRLVDVEHYRIRLRYLGHAGALPLDVIQRGYSTHSQKTRGHSHSHDLQKRLLSVLLLFFDSFFNCIHLSALTLKN